MYANNRNCLSNGGLFIDALGTPCVILCGLLFAALSVLVIAVKALIYRSQHVRVNGIGAVH